MKKTFLLLSMLCFGALATAQTTLFHTGDESGYPYRIPAIAKAKNGDLIALTDRRPCGNDIGYGRVDILAYMVGGRKRACGHRTRSYYRLW